MGFQTVSSRETWYNSQSRGLHAFIQCRFLASRDCPFNTKNTLFHYHDDSGNTKVKLIFPLVSLPKQPFTLRRLKLVTFFKQYDSRRLIKKRKRIPELKFIPRTVNFISSRNYGKLRSWVKVTQG